MHTYHEKTDERGRGWRRKKRSRRILLTYQRSAINAHRRPSLCRVVLARIVRSSSFVAVFVASPYLCVYGVVCSCSKGVEVEYVI